jgi:hypothetical protein
MPTIDSELDNDSKNVSFTKHARNESMSYLHSFPLKISKDELNNQLYRLVLESAPYWLKDFVFIVEDSSFDVVSKSSWQAINYALQFEVLESAMASKPTTYEEVVTNPNWCKAMCKKWNLFPKIKHGP